MENARPKETTKGFNRIGEGRQKGGIAKARKSLRKRAQVMKDINYITVLIGSFKYGVVEKFHRVLPESNAKYRDPKKKHSTSGVFFLLSASSVCLLIFEIYKLS